MCLFILLLNFLYMYHFLITKDYDARAVGNEIYVHHSVTAPSKGLLLRFNCV